MKKTFLIVLLLINNICFAQKETIELPKEGVDKFNKNINHYTIHITSNVEVFFNGEKVLFWDQISKRILEEIRIPKMNAVKDIVVFADKKLDYRIVERIRWEIGKVWSGYLHYMSEELKNKNCLSFYIQGSPLSQKKYSEADWTYGYNLIFTDKQRRLKEDVVFSKVRAQVEWPILAVWQSNFLFHFYTGNVELIKRFLEGKNYKGISILSEEFFRVNGEKTSFKEQKIKDLVKNNDILFVEVNKINFNSYFKAISSVQRLRYKKGNHGELRKPFIIEIPYIYQEELAKKDLNLFNKK
jgi:hypothetical protein